MKQVFWKVYHDAGVPAGGGGGGSKSDKEKLLDEITLQIRSKLEEAGIKNKDSIGEAIREHFKGIDLEGLRAVKKDDLELIGQIRTMAQDIDKLKNPSGTPGEQKDMSIRGQIKAYIEANKEEWTAFRTRKTQAFGTDKEGNSAIELQLRAPGTMTTTSTLNGAVHTPTPEVLPGLVDLNRNRPFIEDYSNTAGTSRPHIVWTEKYNPEGQAEFIAEGAVKPLIDFEIREVNSYAKKVAAAIKVSTEMLEDIDWLAAEIEGELKYQVDIETDGELLSGAGDGTSGATALKGLTQYAGGYVLTSVLTTTPNNFDVIRAGIAQLASLNFIPNYVFINPIDGANMDLVKDGEGRPLAMEYRTANGQVFRVTVVETNRMPIGDFLLGDMTRFKIRNYKPFAVSYGWENDDFRRNLVTVLGERRLHAFVAFNDTGAFIYDQFADVKTAITAP